MREPALLLRTYTTSLHRRLVAPPEGRSLLWTTRSAIGIRDGLQRTNRHLHLHDRQDERLTCGGTSPVDNSFGNSRKRHTLAKEVGVMRELLTVEETAERLRVSVPTVRWLRQEGKLPKAYKVGRRVLWDPQDLDAWLEDQRDPDWSP